MHHLRIRRVTKAKQHTVSNTLYRKCIRLFSGLCVCILLTVANTDAAEFSMDSAAVEKEIALADYKYRTGYYEEATQRSLRLLAAMEKKGAGIKDQIQVRALLLRLYEARLLFEKANEAAKNILEAGKTSSEAAALAYLYLGEHYAQSGRYLEAGMMYEQGSAAGMTSPYKLRYELLKAEIEWGKGYTLSAWESLLKQESEWLRIISGKEVFSLKEQAEHTEGYVRFLNLKTLAGIRSGKFEEAEKNILYSKEWVSSKVGTKHHLYTSVLETEIQLCEAREQRGKLPELYAKAYFLHPASEYDSKKLYLLCMASVQSLQTGDLVSFEKYARQLQINDEQYAGKSDLSHFAYAYVLARQSCEKGDFIQARAILEKLLGRFSFLPSGHRFRQMGESLMGEVYLKSWKLSEYTNYLQKNIQRSAELAGEDAPVTNQAKLQSALFEIAYGTDYKKAEETFTANYAMLVSSIGEQAPENLLYLKSLSELYYQTGRFDSAAVKSSQLCGLTAVLFGEKSLQRALASAEDCLYKLAAGKPGEVLEKFPALIQQEKTLPSDKLARDKRAELLYLLSEVARLTGDIELSRTYSLRSLDLLQYESTIESPSALNTWEQAAMLYMHTGNYFKAESLLKKSLSFKNKNLGEHSPLLLSVYPKLATLYIETGNYSEADRYLKLFSEKATESATGNGLLQSESLLLYGNYHAALGDFKKAEDKYRNSIREQSAVLGKDHLQVASSMMKLAFISSRLFPDKYEENEQLYSEAGKIIEHTIGTHNALYAEYLQKRAAFLIHAGKYQEAKEPLSLAANYWSQKLGSTNKYSADISALEGEVAYHLSSYEEAEKHFLKAAKIYGDIFSKQHPLYAKVTGKAARVYYMQKDVQKSFRTMEEVTTVYMEYTDNYFASLSFSEKEKFWYSLKEEFEFYTFLVLQSMSGDKPELNGRIYDQVIATKALLLSSDIKLRQRIASSGDTALVRMFNDWVGKREFITSAVFLSRAQLMEQGINLEKEILQMEHLEKLMSNRSSVFQESRKNKNVRWQDIRDQLLENEYAVELLRFRYFDKSFTDSVIYAALILNGKFKNYPQLVLMPNGRDMEQKYLKHYRNSAIFKLKDLHSYNAYWKPLTTVIPGNSTVYLSCEGIYNQINLEMIPLPDKKGYVIDESKIILVTNTKDLLNRSGKEKKDEWAGEDYYLLCGNPAFYMDAKTDAERKVIQLPGAEQEVLEIHALLKKSDVKTNCLLNKQVTEDTLKQFSSPALFHIATHGYFAESRKDGEESHASNPLLSSGLVLCGGGDIIDHPENNYVNAQPGILTAYEVLNLNFDRTKLVVLSACETGRGEVQEGEGVFGLQRSFLIAGADAVVMSLFKVNDEATRKFMLTMYEHLIRTGDQRQAFLAAKESIRKEYDNPVYWGAFIMLETYPKEGKN